ncbi:MAG: cell division protein FtsA [Prevotellaceae bacterium]|jgi:cell division protein FtsA|nr:cell division protein FtsA [Prevotellaceae bacterium]
MNYVAAIDLGTTKVVALVGHKTPYGCKVVAYSETPSNGIMRGEVVNIQNVVGAIKPCIDDLQKKIGEKITKVYVGIAGQHIRCQSECNVLNRSNDKDISIEEINQLEQNMYRARVEPGEEVLHVIPQCYHVDDFLEIGNPVGMMGKRIEANYRLFIGRTNSAEFSKRCVVQLGLKLEQLILEPLASAKAVLKDDEKELGVAMVDIGGGTTDLLIYKNNVIRYAAVIPFGGNIITEDVRQGCCVTLRQAEKLKIQYGSCYSDLSPEHKTITVSGIGEREHREISFRMLAKVIEARMEELMEAILYYIDISGYAEQLMAGIVFTGGAALTTNLTHYVKYKTGYEARVAKPENFTQDSCPEIVHPAYSCAVGLLMQGIEHQETKQKPASLNINKGILTLFGLVNSEPEEKVQKPKLVVAEKRVPKREPNGVVDPLPKREKVKRPAVSEKLAGWLALVDNQA